MSPDLAIVLFVIAALVGVVILLLMALLKRQEAQGGDQATYAGLEEFILVDPETGLYNRRFFHKKLEEEIYRSARYNAYFSLAIFDLSRILSDLEKDRAITLLRKLGTTAARDTRFTDIVARIDEYKIALVLSMTPRRVATIPLERLRAKLKEVLQLEGIEADIPYELHAYPDDKATIEKLSISMRP